MPFKVGDRVVCIKTPDGNEGVVGKVGHVYSLEGGLATGAFTRMDWFNVCFEDFTEGWDDSKDGVDNHWSCPEDTLCHISMENV